MNLMRSKHFLKLFTVLCALLMVLSAWLVAYANAALPVMKTLGVVPEEYLIQFEQIGRFFSMICAASAVVFSWLGCKLENSKRLLAVGMGIGCVLTLGIMGVMALGLPMFEQVALRQTMGGMLVSVLLQFALILVLLLAIIRLVGGMIRRHLIQAE